MSYTGCSEDASIKCGNVIQVESGIEAIREDSSKLKIQILDVLRKRDSKWIIFLISCNSAVAYYLWSWSASTESLALKAYANSVVFNVCALAVCLISVWVEQNTLRRSQRFAALEPPPGRKSNSSGKLQKCQRSLSAPSGDLKTASSGVRGSGEATSISVLGLEKYEVLGLLVSSCFSMITGLLVAIDAVARIREQPVVHEGRLGLGAILGLVAHLATIVAHPDAGLNHVVCKALPCPTLKGVNPILGGNLIGFVILCCVHTAIHFWELYTVDTAAAFAVIGLTVASMLPLAFYTASIILQKLSHHMSEQLDKCLREALIIDGVLEFRNERFWTKSFGKLAGSLEVRVRKNADEHYVLRKVVQRLSRVVSTLSVQEFREPSSLFRTSSSTAHELPLEYYVNELLQSHPSQRSKDEEEKAAREKKVDVVRIEEILNCGDGSVKHLLEGGGSGRARQMQRGYATLLRSDEDFARQHRNYLFRELPVTNALLLGSRRDLDDLQSSGRLHRPS